MTHETKRERGARLKKERAARFAEVRADMELTQPEFAARLTGAARELGLDVADYDVNAVTTRENFRKELEIEDYTLVSYIDPARRSWFWLAFGRELPNAMKLERPAKRTQSREG